MKFGSICSGIEAASVAWNPLGWEAAWFSEIEPFPSALLAYRYPGIPNLGDMTALPEKILNEEIEAPELICGGTPCQAFSVAGQRKSLDDERGNLSLVFCEIVNAVEKVRKSKGLHPPIVFWENVPGVLNTKDNAFGCFMGYLSGGDFPFEIPAGRWESSGFIAGAQRQVAWRVLDAQYFGVPQRRKRVFVIASSREGFDPRKVLFESQGVCRDSQKSESEKQSFAGFSEGSFGAFRQTGVAGTCKASGGGRETLVLDTHHFTTHNKAPTLLASMGTGGNRVPCLMDSGGKFMHVINNKNGTLLASAGERNRSPVICLAENTIGRQPMNGGNGSGYSENLSYTLNATGIHGVCTQHKVRRLTPIECERLQGFPDDYTKIPYRGRSVEDCPDSPRYKAIGNSWAVPVVRWLGERMRVQIEGDAYAEE